MEVTEPILDPANFRINMYPIIYTDIWDFYKRSKSSFWIPEEIDMIGDIEDWDKLKEEEKFFIKRILTFFAGSDFIVTQNLDCDFCEKITIPEFRFFYHFQEMMEDIHSDTYVRLLDNYIKDEKEKKELFDSLYTLPGIKDKAEWARKWINPDIPFAQRLVGFAMVEGIFFSGSFCSIFWLNKRNLLKGLCLSNKFISRDEGMHMDFACLVYRKYIVNKLPEEVIINMLRESVSVEKIFIRESIPISLIGMNSDLMSQYIEFVADYLLLGLIGKKLFYSDNPFPWMNLIGMNNKENFFEQRSVTSYANQKAITDEKENDIIFDCKF